ncbi:hypothetical protein [Roseovarius sp. THAF9]|nr:hypothetical protein [Roseovarius sp. THAF9]
MMAIIPISYRNNHGDMRWSSKAVLIDKREAAQGASLKQTVAT